MPAKRILALLSFFLLVAPVAWPAEPQFEVASIKPNVSTERNSTWRFTPGGHFAGENISPKFLITTAYSIRDFQISGAPGWIDSEKYDILAKGEGNPSPEQIRTMLQGLLRDRFKLKYHRVMKQAPVYSLVAAKSGIKLQESKEGSCIVSGPDQKPSRPDEPAPAFCGTYYSRRNQVEGNRITIAQFIAALEFQVDRPIIDKTGFALAFDVHLQWTPDESTVDSSDGVDPSIFTALQEQLGLKLESRKGPVQTLVIDHIEKPGEN
jgi:uncharacterized protein (TIGR03435 family)